MHFFLDEFVPANPLEDASAEKFSNLIDSYILKYSNQEIMGTLHSDSHMPAGAYNYLYNRNVPVKDSAFYDRIDQELIASKALDDRYILAANIERSITYDPNNVQSIEYKLKTIIKVSEEVGWDRYGDACQYILSVFGPSKYEPKKTAIVTQYPAAVNQYARHMNAQHPCVYIRDNTTKKLKSFSKLTRPFLERTDRVVNFCDISQDF